MQKRQKQKKQNKVKKRKKKKRRKQGELFMEENIRKMLDEDLALYRSYKWDATSATLNNGLDYFMSIVKSVPLLTPEKEKVYTRLCCEGNDEAKEILVMANLRLVAKIANRYKNRTFDTSDCIQEGIIGLMRAIDKFDPNQGYKLCTYATWWIFQAIERALNYNGSSIRVPDHMVLKRRKVMKAAGEITGRKDGEAATIEEIAEATGETVKAVEDTFVYGAKSSTVSLDAQVGDSKEDSFISRIADTSQNDAFGLNEFDRIELSATINDALDVLTEKEKYIIVRRYGLDNRDKETLTEIGKKFNVSRERIRQLETKALKKLSADSNLKEFLPYIA